MCLVGIVIGAIFFVLSFGHFSSNSVANTILTSNYLRYVALACFLAATIDGVILHLRDRALNPIQTTDQAALQGTSSPSLTGSSASFPSTSSITHTIPRIPTSSPSPSPTDSSASSPSTSSITPTIPRTQTASQPSKSFPRIENTLNLRALSDLWNAANDHNRAGRYAEMIACYNQAAILGDPAAINILGDFYMHSESPDSPQFYGKGITPDFAKAFSYYSRAAEMNHPEATCNLGHCYKSGWGTAKDHGKAYESYQKAFEILHHTPAAAYLAICYEEGIGIPKDPVKARSLNEMHRLPHR